MNIYIDIGNTNIKITFKLNNKDYLRSYVTNQEFTVDQLYDMFPREIKDKEINNVWLVSVVPNKNTIFAHAFKKYFNIEIKIIQFPIKTGIQMDVDRAKSVGSDIVCLSAFVANNSKNGIIVNAGTATTITHVKNNTMQGAIIIPGLKLSYDSLISKATKIGEVSLKLKKNISIGKNTEEAISLGVIKGHIHMINNFVKEIDENAELFLSGGNSIYLKENLENFNFIKEATLKGAMIIAERNEKEG